MLARSCWSRARVAVALFSACKRQGAWAHAAIVVSRSAEKRALAERWRRHGIDRSPEDWVEAVIGAKKPKEGPAPPITAPTYPRLVGGRILGMRYRASAVGGPHLPERGLEGFEGASSAGPRMLKNVPCRGSASTSPGAGLIWSRRWDRTGPKPVIDQRYTSQTFRPRSTTATGRPSASRRRNAEVGSWLILRTRIAIFT